MQPFPTSNHSSTFSPPLFTVKDFSMSSAVPVLGGLHREQSHYSQSPNSSVTSAKALDQIAGDYQTVHDDCDLLAMLSRENVIQQRGLAGSEVPW